MKNLYLLLLIIFTVHLYPTAQGLYIFSEPASNMPAKTVGFKLTGTFPSNPSFAQRYKPEIMFGINKNWMVHVSTSFSDYYSENLRYESVRGYVKYRFLSNDDIHRHFRMAAFADLSFTRSPYLYDEMSLEGDNDGAQLGLITTKLVNKFALSATTAYTRLFRDSKSGVGYNVRAEQGINYSLSAGYLLLPKEYVDYKQTNLNLYCELMGAKSLDNNRYLVDLAPALQFIFNSNSKINVGYRFQLASNMTRMARGSFLVGLEHTLFNAWK